MMRLILSLTLIWTLSSTAEALQCWHGEGDKTRELRPCASTTEWCATVATQQESFDAEFHQTINRSCETPPPHIKGKHTFSFNVGFIAKSIHVCNTDGCNSEDIPYPKDLKKNRLQCFACDDPFSAECKKIVQCVGDENCCFSETLDDNKAAKVHTFGCVSGDLCEHLIDPRLLPYNGKFIQPAKCCEGSFFNSSWSIKLNVMTLLFGLITLICY